MFKDPGWPLIVACGAFFACVQGLALLFYMHAAVIPLRWDINLLIPAGAIVLAYAYGIFRLEMLLRQRHVGMTAKYRALISADVERDLLIGTLLRLDPPMIPFKTNTMWADQIRYVGQEELPALLEKYKEHMPIQGAPPKPAGPGGAKE